MRNNHEAVTAKSIAEALGFKWYFIELNIKEQKSFYKSKEFLNYIAYADTADAVPYYQGLYSVKFLKENKIISNDAVFISGNSGDFITGGHSSLYDKSCGAHSISEHFVKRIIKKHYSLWGNLKTKNNKRLIGDMIKRDYNIFSERYSIDFDACDFAYYYELVNRQSKYVVQGQKVYEYYGFDWALPLWDKRLLLFWSSVPYAYNKDQFLYKKTIMNYNYSDVWGEDFTVNKTKINSYILRYFRYLAKTLSLLFSVGNIEFWNNVDRVFFLYYYDITRMMCSVRYYNIISSFFKHPRHNVSFDALKYIADHKKKLLKQSNSEI
jgi:asparagine synthase (glutamine-hydrolysing)